MSQEVSKRLGSMGYNPSIPHGISGLYNPLIPNPSETFRKTSLAVSSASLWCKFSKRFCRSMAFARGQERIGGKLPGTRELGKTVRKKRCKGNRRFVVAGFFWGDARMGCFFEGGNKKLGNNSFFWAASLVGDMFFHSCGFLKVRLFFGVIGCFLLMSFSKECIEAVYTLPKTNIAPENGWLGDNPFLLGWPIFGGELLVSGRAGGM